MNLFSETAYLTAILNGPPPTWREESYKTFQYQRVQIPYESFSKEYSSAGWVGRKAVALPMAVFCGLIKTVYHVALIIFNNNFSKIHKFSVSRDFQESFGWLVSLINDRRGQFYIQESNFHKTYYSLFEHSFSVSEEILFDEFEGANTYVSNPNHSYFEKLAHLYLDRKELQKAFTVISAMRDGQQKNVFLVQLANAFYAAKQFDLAFEAFKGTDKSFEKSEFLKKIFNGCGERNYSLKYRINLFLYVEEIHWCNNALNCYRKVTLDPQRYTYTSEPITKEAAEKYYQEVKESLKSIVYHGLFIRCLEIESEETFDKIMNEFDGENFIVAMVDNWLKGSEYYYYKTGPLSRYNFQDLDQVELETFFLERLKLIFQNFLNLLPPEDRVTAFNPYKVLGLERNASQETIRDAYKTLSLLHHPDKVAQGGKKTDENEEDFEKRIDDTKVKFQEIKRAYEIIKNLSGK